MAGSGEGGDTGIFGDWDLWFAITNPAAFERLAKHNIRVVGERIGLKGQAMVTDLLSERPEDPIVPNAPLTIALKGKDAALVDKQNQIVRSTNYDQPENGRIRIGSRITADSGVDITNALHYGFTFDLAKYPGMRAWLMRTLAELDALGRLVDGETRGPKGKPGFIVIPPRPWIGWLFESREFKDFVIESTREAMQATLHGIDLATGAPVTGARRR